MTILNNSRLMKICLFVILLLSSLEIFHLDYILGEINLILPYLIIIYLSVWFIGNKSGLFFLILSICLWILSITQYLEIFNVYIWVDAAIKISLLLIQYLIIVKLKILYSEVKELALTDDLTGLNNRRGFYHLMKYQLHRIDRESEFISLIYIDIDNFKKENDKKGHKEGDRILKKLSETIAEATRLSDISARIGGDEFCIFIYNTDHDTIKEVIERIADRFQKICDENSWITTLSIGVFTTDKDVDIDDLISRGDQLMYKAKSGGKKRIIYEFY